MDFLSGRFSCLNFDEVERMGFKWVSFKSLCWFCRDLDMCFT